MVADAYPLPDARIALASAHAWAEADARLASLLGSGVTPARALLAWGEGLFKGGRAADAVTVFGASAALDPSDSMIWTNLGIALGSTGAHREATLCLERSLTLRHHQPDTWLLLGMARSRTDGARGAEAAYRNAIELEPRSAIGWKCLGSFLAERGDAPGAVAAFTEALDRGGPDAAVCASLARLLYEEGRVVDAHEAYLTAQRLDLSNAHFRHMARTTGFLRALVTGADVDTALRAFEAGVSPGPDAAERERERLELFDAAAGLLTGFGHLEAALRLAQRRVELWPASASAHYLLMSLRGGSELAQAPVNYLVETFDAFADDFDAQLVGVLGYDVPEKLAGLVGDLTEARHLYENVLDAGCGTGLCGARLRPLAKHLTGVDLAPRMLEHAAKRGTYDALACAEITAFLDQSPAVFDLVMAADVFIYFGDLRPLLAAASRAIRPRGLFAISAERSDAPGYRLNPSGRFSHAPAYVEELARGTFEIASSVATTLRRDGHTRVGGQLFVLRRRATA